MGIFGISRNSGQKALQEEEAIQTLSNRLQHATLSADRKSAVLGLKSFSHKFREPVVQHGLRALLLTLGKDVENAPLVKAVLETLLILFLRGEDANEDSALGWISNQSRVQNGKYPSPLLVERIELDEFSDWIADELILSDEHIKVLMEVLQEHQGFQVRLFSLQLLEAVVAARPVRAKDCIINIPLAISSIVSLLDDPNDPIRNEAILLLMALVNHNFNIQKLVAFENTFGKLFEIIEEEGGIRGSILVQDCMTLLTNLLQYNASNQKFFLETDCVPQLARLIAEPIEDNQYEGDIPSAPIVWTDQRLLNMTIALEICGTFVDSDNQELKRNQEKLFSSGIFFSVLRLVFSPVMEVPIRKTALKLTGAIIAENADLQYEFSQIDVPYMDPSMPVQLQRFDNIPAPLALLNWALLVNSVHIFEIRVAAVECLICYLKGNDEAKMAFVSDQIKASKNPNHYVEIRQPNLENDETQPDDDNLRKTPYANIITVLTVYDSDIKLNPYCAWFAAILLVYISLDSPETKVLMRETKIGDAEEGEEVMTFIQALSGMLITNLDNSDPRIAIGYLILLTFWLYEDFEAVNDFLTDPSMIKAILAFLSKNSTESSDLVHGMCCVFAGVCFEFTTKTSPIPRASLYELITKALGADNYSQKVKQFKENGLFKRFDLDSDIELHKDSTGLPVLFFIPEYVELVRENFYRIRKALFRGPDFEPKSRISYEIFEELENKNVDLRKELEQLGKLAKENEERLKMDIQHSQEELEIITKSLETCRLELEETKQSEQSLTSKIETLSAQLKTLGAEKSKCDSSLKHYTSEFNKLTKLHSQDEDSVKSLKAKLSEVEASKQKAEDGINKMNRELFQLTREQKESSLKVASHEQEMKKLRASLEAEVSKYQAKAEATQKINEELKVKLLMTGVAKLDLKDSKNGPKLREFQVEISQLEEKNDSLMEKLRAAASVVQELRSERTQLKESKFELEQELTKAYEDLESFSNVLDEVNELKEGTETSDSSNIQTLRRELELVTEEKTQVEEKLAEAVRELNDLKDPKFHEKEVSTGSSGNGNIEEISRLQTELEELQKNLVEMQSSFEDQKESLLKEIEKYKTEEHLNSLSDSRKEVESDTQLEGTISGEISDLQEELKKKENDLEITKNRMKHLESNIEILSQSASSSLASFKKSQDDLKKRISELEATQADLENEIEQLKQRQAEELEKHQEALDDAENSNMDLELLNSNLEKNMDEILQKFANLEKDSGSKIESLARTIEQLEKQLEETKAERDGVNSDYIELEKLTNIISSELQAKDALLQAMNNKGADLAAKDKIVIEIKGKLTHAISELGESAQNLRVALKERAELEKLYNDAQSQLEQATKEISELKDEIETSAGNLEQTRAERRKLSSLLTEYSDLKKTYQENTEKMTALEDEISSLQEALKSKSHALEENKKLAQDASQAAISEYTERISKLEVSLLEKQKSHDTEILEVRSKAQEAIDELSQKAKRIENEALLKTNENSSAIKNELAEKRSELAKCKSMLEEKTAENVSLLLEIESSREKNGSLNIENTESEKTQVGKLAEELEASSKEVESLNQEIEKLRKDLAESQTYLSQKEAEVIEILEAKNIRAKDKLDLEAQLRLAQQKCEQLESQLQIENNDGLQQERLEKESAQKDLYDMMLLYEAQEKVLEKYKRRMEALDVIVSDEEAAAP